MDVQHADEAFGEGLGFWLQGEIFVEYGVIEVSVVGLYVPVDVSEVCLDVLFEGFVGVFQL